MNKCVYVCFVMRLECVWECSLFGTVCGSPFEVCLGVRLESVLECVWDCTPFGTPFEVRLECVWNVFGSPLGVRLEPPLKPTDPKRTQNTPETDSKQTPKSTPAGPGWEGSGAPKCETCVLFCV